MYRREYSAKYNDSKHRDSIEGFHEAWGLALGGLILENVGSSALRLIPLCSFQAGRHYVGWEEQSPVFVEDQ